MRHAAALMQWALVLAILGAAAGCGAPLYRPAPMAADASALIDLAGTGVKWICAQGEPHRLLADADGNARIPAGTRLTVGAWYDERLLRCLAAVSFIPEAGQRYRIDIQLAAEHCKASVFIDAPDTVIGARLVQGTRPARACDL